MFLACKKWITLSCFSLAFFSVFFCSSVWAENIIIGGTGNALGTMQILAKAYHERNPDIHITVLPSIGSSGAIKAVPRGKIDIGLSTRRFKTTEFTAEASVTEYARTPTVIAVSNNLDVTDISIDELVDIYNGEQTVWSNGDLVRPIIRQHDDDNTKQLEQLSPELKNAIDFAEKRTGLLFASTDQETVEKIEQTPGSFGVTTLALILSEKRSIHALKLNGVKPTAKTCIVGSYPIIKHFYFILPKNIPGYVADFISFVNSPIGKEILESNGNYIPE
ncbi:PstS family phosphate ABC transporter substrate-binding protein [Shewanella sp. MEBiC00475]|uniref:PstS family phosphate ABC transporter substrate-binding protein n=1 Tax=Shewanella sp. MEBiC00475 TaxID=2575361 RepID=UPI0010C04574|nr:substrate-binding domain-containing protein [Shewanella sp. MEBiC00475]